MIKIMSKDSNKELEILAAAEKIFAAKGCEGARMQEIADEAGINKSLLHYYYRSKEKLFLAVFKNVLLRFLPRAIKKIRKEDSIFVKIETFCSMYIEMVNAHPAIPLFVLHELNKNPENIISIISSFFESNGGNFIIEFKKEFAQAIKDGVVKPVRVEHVIINIMSLCVFPAISRPIYKRVLFNDNKREFNKFVEERKKVVSEFIINAILP